VIKPVHGAGTNYAALSKVVVLAQRRWWWRRHSWHDLSRWRGGISWRGCPQRRFCWGHGRRRRSNHLIRFIGTEVTGGSAIPVAVQWTGCAALVGRWANAVVARVNRHTAGKEREVPAGEGSQIQVSRDRAAAAVIGTRVIDCSYAIATGIVGNDAVADG